MFCKDLQVFKSQHSLQKENLHELAASYNQIASEDGEYVYELKESGVF